MANRNIRVVKATKEEKRIKEGVNTAKQIKELVIIVLVVSGIFLLIYLLTIGANKLGWFDEHYSKPAIQDATISYETIEAGTILNRSENEYYVAIYNFKENSMYIEALISSFKSNEDNTKIYKVDLSDGLNRSIVSDTTVTNVDKVSDLKISDSTLLLVRNGKIIESYIGMQEIENVLK